MGRVTQGNCARVGPAQRRPRREASGGGGAASVVVRVLLATLPRNEAVFSYSTECVSGIAENAASIADPAMVVPIERCA